MAVRIRLRRIGGRNDPVFRIVVADARSPRDGRFIETLGTYDPKKAENNCVLNLDRARYWLSKGAQPTETVRSILKRAERAVAAATSS